MGMPQMQMGAAMPAAGMQYSPSLPRGTTILVLCVPQRDGAGAPMVVSSRTQLVRCANAGMAGFGGMQMGMMAPGQPMMQPMMQPIMKPMAGGMPMQVRPGTCPFSTALAWGPSIVRV